MRAQIGSDGFMAHSLIARGGLCSTRRRSCIGLSHSYPCALWWREVAGGRCCCYFPALDRGFGWGPAQDGPSGLRAGELKSPVPAPFGLRLPSPSIARQAPASFWRDCTQRRFQTSRYAFESNTREEATHGSPEPPFHPHPPQHLFLHVAEPQALCARHHCDDWACRRIVWVSGRR